MDCKSVVCSAKNSSFNGKNSSFNGKNSSLSRSFGEKTSIQKFMPVISHQADNGHFPLSIYKLGQYDFLCSVADAVHPSHPFHLIGGFQKEIYTIEEISQIFALLDQDEVPIKFRAFFKLAVYSGFRRGELLGLEWKDIDWDSNLISVKRTSNYTAEKGIYTDTTKTKKSKRVSKLPTYVMEMCSSVKKKAKINSPKSTSDGDIGSKRINI